MAKRSFKKLAKRLMDEHGTSDPFKIAEREGIQIIFLDFKAWLGLYTCVDGVRTIFINSNIPEFSQKIVCGHELGHSQQTFKEENYLFGVNKLETEANEFDATIIFSEEINDEDLTEFDINLLNELKKYL